MPFLSLAFPLFLDARTQTCFSRGTRSGAAAICLSGTRGAFCGTTLKLPPSITGPLPRLASASVLGLLQRVDRSFRKNRSYQAINDDTYLVDLIRPASIDEMFCRWRCLHLL